MTYYAIRNKKTKRYICGTDYRVGIIEKDTNYIIDNIIIKDISEIEILRGESIAKQ